MTLLLPSREFRPSDIEDAFCAHSSLSLSVNCTWELKSRIRLEWRKIFKTGGRVWIRPSSSSILRSEVFELFTGIYLFARHYTVLMSHLASRDFLRKACFRGESQKYWGIFFKMSDLYITWATFKYQYCLCGAPSGRWRVNAVKSTGKSKLVFIGKFLSLIGERGKTRWWKREPRASEQWILSPLFSDSSMRIYFA